MNLHPFTTSLCANDDNEFRFSDTSTHEGHLHQNSMLISFVKRKLCHCFSNFYFSLDLWTVSSLSPVPSSPFLMRRRCTQPDPILLTIIIVEMGKDLVMNIGIKHGFSCINIRQVLWKVLKTEAEGRGFQHLPRDLANVNALKNHV